MRLDLKRSLLDQLRLASLLDGVSYIILLGIAMPLKYAADMPMVVRIVGSAHGFLWIALCLFLLLAFPFFVLHNLLLRLLRLSLRLLLLFTLLLRHEGVCSPVLLLSLNFENPGKNNGFP